MLTLLFTTEDACSAEPDLQLWMPIQFVHPINDDWVVSMQTETRLKDDITEFSELVLKPGVHYHFNSEWVFSAGYRHIDKYQETKVPMNERIRDRLFQCQAHSAPLPLREGTNFLDLSKQLLNNDRNLRNFILQSDGIFLIYRHNGTSSFNLLE